MLVALLVSKQEILQPSYPGYAAELMGHHAQWFWAISIIVFLLHQWKSWTSLEKFNGRCLLALSLFMLISGALLISWQRQ